MRGAAPIPTLAVLHRHALAASLHPSSLLMGEDQGARGAFRSRTFTGTSHDRPSHPSPASQSTLTALPGLTRQPMVPLRGIKLGTRIKYGCAVGWKRLRSSPIASNRDGLELSA
jgi:hypothetical protein